jgi:hypothetical protein
MVLCHGVHAMVYVRSSLVVSGMFCHGGFPHVQDIAVVFLLALRCSSININIIQNFLNINILVPSISVNLHLNLSFNSIPKFTSCDSELVQIKHLLHG